MLSFKGRCNKFLGWRSAPSSKQNKYKAKHSELQNTKDKKKPERKYRLTTKEQLLIVNCVSATVEARKQANKIFQIMRGDSQLRTLFKSESKDTSWQIFERLSFTNPVWTNYWRRQLSPENSMEHKHYW